MSLPLGLTWTEITDSESLGITKCIWAADVFVQVGNRSGNIGSGGNANRIRTSPDGVTWTTVSDGGLAYDWRGVAWAPPASGLGSGQGRLVAVTATVVETLGATPTQQITTSDDGGATWTPRTSPEINQWQDVIWCASLNLFVAVAQSGTNRVMTSSDGVTWFASAAAAVKNWNSVAFDPSGKLIATAGTTSTTSIMSSTNGTSWTSETSGSFNFRQRSCVWSPLLGVFMVATSSDHILTSPTGVTWTDQGAQAFSRQIAAADVLGIVMISGGNVGGTYLKVLETEDGTSFTAENTDPGFIFAGGNLDAIGFSPDLAMFAITYNGNNTHIVTGLGAPTVLSVTDVDPDHDYLVGGATVTITGTAFVATPTVQFGRFFGEFVEATDVVFVNDTTLTCTVPAHLVAETVVIVVTNPDDEYAALYDTFFYVEPSTAGGGGSFTIVPDNGPVTGGTAVTITANDTTFAAGSQVYFDGVIATSIVVVNPTTITCVTPAHVRGAVEVTIKDS